MTWNLLDLLYRHVIHQNSSNFIRNSPIPSKLALKTNLRFSGDRICSGSIFGCSVADPGGIRQFLTGGKTCCEQTNFGPKRGAPSHDCALKSLLCSLLQQIVSLHVSVSALPLRKLHFFIASSVIISGWIKEGGSIINQDQQVWSNQVWICNFEIQTINQFFVWRKSKHFEYPHFYLSLWPMRHEIGKSKTGPF